MRQSFTNERDLKDWNQEKNGVERGSWYWSDHKWGAPWLLGPLTRYTGNRRVGDFWGVDEDQRFAPITYWLLVVESVLRLSGDPVPWLPGDG